MYTCVHCLCVDMCTLLTFMCSFVYMHMYMYTCMCTLFMCSFVYMHMYMYTGTVRRPTAVLSHTYNNVMYLIIYSQLI